MLLLNQYFDIKITKANIEWYQSKGYNCNLKDLLKVEAKDLSLGSHKIIIVSCDYCNCIIKKPFYLYVRDNINGIIHKDACKKCYPLKVKESNLKIYGVENINQLEEIKNKTVQTNLKKYGTEYYMQTEEYIDKVKQTNLEKYGVEWVLQNENIKEKGRQTSLEKYGVSHPMMSDKVLNKVKQTNLEKYGTEWGLQNENIKKKAHETNLKKYGKINPFQSEIIKAKIRQTNLERYGFENPSQSLEIQNKKEQTLLKNWGVKAVMHHPYLRKKVRNSLYKNNNVPSSKQQIYLCNLLNGVLNKSIGQYNVDIFLDNNIIVEYDGGGHNLQVKLGNMTKKEFINKEKRRNKFLKSKGYKIIKIISPNDYLPSDKIILKEIELAKEYFLLENTLYVINIGEFINDKVYGKLRKIV